MVSIAVLQSKLNKLWKYPQDSNFDNFCSFFECHTILTEKQRTKQTDYSSLSLSASLETQDTFQDGVIVDWNKFWQEVPVCRGGQIVHPILLLAHPALGSFLRHCDHRACYILEIKQNILTWNIWPENMKNPNLVDNQEDIICNKYFKAVKTFLFTWCIQVM